MGTAVESWDELMSTKFAVMVAVAIFASLGINVFIVGLNQLFDIEIDIINKPTLPLASGELTYYQGWAIVIGCLSGGLAIGVEWGSDAPMSALIYTAVLGTVYSMPPFRLKRFPLPAAACIILVRGVIVQFYFYLNARAVLGYDDTGKPFPLSVVYASVFIIVFSIVIALMKDVPDIEGDRKHDINSFAVRMGAKRIFNVCVGLLIVDYLVGVAVGFMSTTPWSSALAFVRARKVDVSSQKAFTGFYMFIWKIFYVQ